MTKEEIEQAAEEMYPPVVPAYEYDAFKKGAQWAAERLYTKKELKKAFLAGMFNTSDNKPDYEFRKWLNERKKK